MPTPPITSLTPHNFGRWGRAAGRRDWLSGVIIPRTQSREAGTGWAVSKLDVPPEVTGAPPLLLTQLWGTEGSRWEVSAHQGPGQRPWEENSSWQSPGLIVEQNGVAAPGLVVLGPQVWDALVASSQGLDEGLAPPSTPCAPTQASHPL